MTINSNELKILTSAIRCMENQIRADQIRADQIRADQIPLENTSCGIL